MLGGFGGAGFGALGFEVVLVTVLPGHFLMAALAASTDALYLAYSDLIVCL